MKKQKTKGQLEKEVKVANRVIGIVFFGFLIAVSMFFYVVYDDLKLEFQELPKENEMMVRYINESINQDHLVTIQKLVNEIKPEYLIAIKSITLVSQKDLDRLHGETGYIGFNRGGKIYITKRLSRHGDRVLLCHEVLHSLISSIDKESEEKIVDELDGSLVCFRNTNN